MKLLTSLAVTAALALPTFAQAKTTELIYNIYLPPQNPARKAAVEDFAERVAKESGGSVKISIPSMSLAPSDEQYSMLLDGVADIAWLPTDDMPQVVTYTGIADLPGNAPTAESASVATWETYNKFFAEHDEYKGVKVLWIHALGGRQLMGLKNPVDAADAIQGLKVWTPNGPLTDIVEGLDGVPIHMNFAGLFEIVSKNAVDALVASPGAAFGSRTHTYVNHMSSYEGGLGSVSFAVAISGQAWSGLDADQQAAILRASEGMSRPTGAATDGLERFATMKMPDLKVIPTSDALNAALDPILQDITDGWIKDAADKGLADPKAALEFYRSVLDREMASK